MPSISESKHKNENKLTQTILDLNKMANSLLLHDPEGGLEIASKAKGLASEGNLGEGLAESYKIISKAHLELSQLEQALENAYSSWKHYQKTSNEKEEAHVLCLIASIYLKC